MHIPALSTLCVTVKPAFSAKKFHQINRYIEKAISLEMPKERGRQNEEIHMNEGRKEKKEEKQEEREERKR